MPPIIKRRTGKGFEREIQTLTRLRTAIILDLRIDTSTHGKVLNQIDALIESLSFLIKSGFNDPPGDRKAMGS